MNMNAFDKVDTLPSSSSNNQKRAAPRLSAEVSIEMPKKKAKKAKDAFRTISEVAKKLNVQQHVLRFWETKFSQVKPLKRGGGRRYYRPEDVALLERIHHLLYTEGYTIKGVQKLLKEKGKAKIIAEAANDAALMEDASAPADAEIIEQPVAEQPQVNAQQRVMLEILLAELKAMRALINA